MRAVLVIVMATALAWPAAADTVPSYKVIAEQKSDSYRAVDIRIEQRLDETDLAAIANAIVGREQRPHARTIVNFLLPTARPGDQPWASATLLREVRVKIPGLRLDEERLFTAEAHADRRDVIGAWLTSTPATPGRLTIFREGKRLYAEWRLRSGVTTKDELSETRVADVVVNGATFPLDEESGRPVIAFSERGIPVDPSNPTNWGGGAGAIYMTDGRNTVYAAVVQPLGNVQLRVFDNVKGEWR